jgi:hypothetical protein
MLWEVEWPLIGESFAATNSIVAAEARLWRPFFTAVTIASEFRCAASFSNLKIVLWYNAQRTCFCWPDCICQALSSCLQAA